MVNSSILMCVLYMVLGSVHTQRLDLNMEVQCRTAENCVGDYEIATMKECCYQTNFPDGLAFTIEGEEGCNLCSEIHTQRLDLNMEVQCRTTENCVGDYEIATMKECCYQTGLAFTIEGEEGCNLCSETIDLV